MARMHSGVRDSPMAAVVALAVLMSLVLAPVLGMPSARAALNGSADLEIDGDAIGPNDWENPPGNLLDFADIPDPCGNVTDPNVLSGKLDDLVLDQPDPKPGKANATADLCHAWYALDAAPQPDGTYHTVLYGAWERQDTTSATNGEAAVFFPLIGPQPGNADDLLLVFDYTSSGGGATSLVIMQWDGTTWIPTALPPDAYTAALDDPAAPSFGEFAVDLNLAGLLDTGSCVVYQLIYTFTKGGTLESNATLQDFAGPAVMTVDACSTVTIRKATTPTQPEPAAAFDITASRLGGGVVIAPDQTSVDAQLVVPGSPTVTLERVVPADDYTLAEADPPAGWALDSVVCTTLNPLTGDIEDYLLTPQSPAFPTTPGQTAECVVTNRATTAGLTIIKVAEGEDPPGFDFTISGGVDASFTLTNGQSWTSTQVQPGESTIVELPTDGWELSSVECTGADPVVDLEQGTVAVDLAAGDRAVCAFINVVVPPAPASLTVVKEVPAADGTQFPFTVAGPGAPGTPLLLTPPDSASATVQLAPAAGGSQYTVAEDLPDGWQAAATACTVNGQPVAEQPPGSAALTLAPGDTALCTFRNEPVPPITLTVAKIARGGQPPVGGFGFTLTGGLDTAFALADQQSWTTAELQPGTTTITEAPADGWTLTGVQCSGAEATVDLAAGTAVLDLTPGDTATCVFTNTADAPPPASITITKQVPAPDGTEFAFTAEGPGAPPTFTLAPPDPASTTFAVAPAAGGSPYTITETPADGWVATATACQINGGPAPDQTPGTAVLTLLPGDTATCTFTNAPPPPPATLTVIKSADGVDAPQFAFTAAGGTSAQFALGDQESWDSGPLEPGTTTITETPADGWALTAVECTGTEPAVDLAAGTAVLDLAPGDSATCVFTNTAVQIAPPELASLTVVKEVPAADGTQFPFTVAGPGAPGTPLLLAPPDSASATVQLAPTEGGSQYTVAEDLPEGWLAAGTACTVNGQPVAEQPPGSAALTLAPGDTALCTFRNEPVPPAASLTIAKRTEPAGLLPEGQDGFSFGITGLARIGRFLLADGDAQTFSDIPTAQYIVGEQVPAGWAAIIACTGIDPESVEQLGAGRVQVTLSPGDDVTCTYTNILLPTLQITKVADPQAAQDFPFVVFWERTFYTDFALDDDGSVPAEPADGDLSNTASLVDLRPGVWTIEERSVADWSLRDITCSGAEAVADLPAGVVRVTLEPGQTAQCTFENVQAQSPPEPPIEPPPPVVPPVEPPVEPQPPTGEPGTSPLPDTGGTGEVLWLAMTLLLAGAFAVAVSRQPAAKRR